MLQEGEAQQGFSTCVCFLCLIQARETSGWETTGRWLCCQWTRILTRRESRTRVKMEKSKCILIGKSNVYWQPRDGMMLCKANSCAPGAQWVSVRSLGSSACVSEVRLWVKQTHARTSDTLETLQELGGSVRIDVVISTAPRLLPPIP